MAPQTRWLPSRLLVPRPRPLPRSMRLAPSVAGATALLLAAGTLIAGPAQADPAPKVGGCFTVTPKQAGATAWPARSENVPCTGTHNFEIYEVATVPARTPDPHAYAKRACTSQGVSKHFGVNKPFHGVIKNPSRLSSFSFTTPTGYVCAAAIPTYSNLTKYTLRPLAAPLASVLRTHAPSLKWCMAGSKTKPSASIRARPCSARPVWRIKKLADLRTLYPSWFAKYPGWKSVQATMRRLCAKGNWYGSAPDKKAYAQGQHTIVCYRRVA